MNLIEARQILKNHGYVMLKEREYTVEESDKIWNALLELKKDFENKGYTVELHPTEVVGYYANLGYDPTIGTDYYSRRTAEQTAYRKDVFKSGIKNIVKDGEVPGKFLLSIKKEPSDEYKKYLYKKVGKKGLIYHKHEFEIYIGFELRNEHEGDDLEWKIGKSYYNGTVDDFISAVKKNVAEAEQKCKIDNYEQLKYGMAEKDNYVTDKEERRRAAEKRKYDRIEKLFYKDMINNFDLCREIDENELNHIIMQRVADNINDYMFNEYADEDGRVPLWDEDNAWNYFDDDFCGYLDQEYDGDFTKFCEENDINTVDDLDSWLDEWDYDYPPDPT